MTTSSYRDTRPQAPDAADLGGYPAGAGHQPRVGRQREAAQKPPESDAPTEVFVGADAAPGTSTHQESARLLHQQRVVYQQVQCSPEFQEIRRRYRRFVLPACCVFVSWYLLYVLASTTARGPMSRPLVGQCNIAMAFGLAQFASTFLIAWLYARHARRRRDRAALNLRWDTQERFR